MMNNSNWYFVPEHKIYLYRLWKNSVGFTYYKDKLLPKFMADVLKEMPSRHGLMVNISVPIDHTGDFDNEWFNIIIEEKGKN